MKIIDSHTHIGASRTASIDIPESTWIKTMERYHLDGIFVLPLPDPYPDSRTVHDRIYKFSQDYPGKVWGIADINPRCGEEEYMEEATRCVKELGFIALKLHPFLEATNPRGKHAVKVYEAARALDVPVLVHTGQGAPMALPSMMIPIAKKYPDVKFVLSHAGAFVYFDEALIAAQCCENIYLETSWCGAGQILGAINTIGADRVMFGSDGDLEVGPALAKAEALDLPEDKLEKYLGKTAIEVFGLKE